MSVHKRDLQTVTNSAIIDVTTCKQHTEISQLVNLNLGRVSNMLQHENKKVF